MNSGCKAGLAVMLVLAGCAKPPPPVVVQAPPPPPVGHVYPVAVIVPPPAHKWIRVTDKQHAMLQQAFNVIGLKSALMVGALSCNQQPEYDTFMTEFQPHILAEQHVMDAYFRRIGSRSAEDSFVTLLANNQSVSGINEGSIFCLNNQAEFQAVMALKTPQDLDAFVTDAPPAGATSGQMASTSP